MDDDTRIECIFSEGHRLAEGPLWDAEMRRLLWVDIEGRSIHSARADGNRHKEYAIPGGVSSISLTDSGHYLCTSDKAFLLLTKSFEEVWRSEWLEASLIENRFNDAKVDPHGRLWAGTMHRRMRNPIGNLYCLDSQLEWTRQDTGYIVSNGPTFSLDGRYLYHTDSVRRTIYRFELASNGSISGKEDFIQFEEEEGYPDGMTTDSEGCLWVASYHGGRIMRFSAGGDWLLTIDLPTSNITSCVFGGENYQTLFVTSATSGLTEDQKVCEPLAGGIFRIEGDFQGLPPNEFRLDPETLASLDIDDAG